MGRRRFRIRITTRRLASLITTAASIIAIIAFLEVATDWNVTARLGEFIDQIGRFAELIPPLTIGPLGLGQIIIIALAVMLFLVIFVERRPEPARGGQGPRAGPEPQKVKPINFMKSDVVNAPIGRVFKTLSATECGPTLYELLDHVDSKRVNADLIRWSGTGPLASGDFSLEGTTKLTEPMTMEIACTGGAIKGFRSKLTLREMGETTRVKHVAEYRPSSLPPKLAPVAEILTDVIPDILDESLDKLLRGLENSERVG